VGADPNERSASGFVVAMMTTRAPARAAIRAVASPMPLEPPVITITCRSRGLCGEATHVVADVGRREDVQAIADKAVQRFGGFDTWVKG
jgi:NAD(P)-dependent dehydrogenase (short-subunit alcohol dehydrogenase family)